MQGRSGRQSRLKPHSRSAILFMIWRQRFLILFIFFYLVKAKKKAMIVRIMTSSITRKSFLVPEQSLFCLSWQVLFPQGQPLHREDRESERQTCRRLQP